MRNLFLSIALLAALPAFSMNQKCVDHLNKKLGCGQNVLCWAQKGNLVPGECKKEYEAIILKVSESDPCTQEKKQKCPNGECNKDQIKSLSGKCRQGAILEANALNQARGIANACQEAMSKLGCMDVNNPARNDPNNMLNCMQQAKSKLPANCRQALGF